VAVTSVDLGIGLTEPGSGASISIYGWLRVSDSHTAPTLVEVTALGAAGHGTAVEGVSDRVEARSGEWRKPLARHFAIRSRNAVSDASPTYVASGHPGNSAGGSAPAE